MLTRGTVESVLFIGGSFAVGELADLLADAEAPTSDDVSVTEDGRRLDTAESVMAFFDELRAIRS